jgi:prefoldin subunit 5
MTTSNAASPPPKLSLEQVRDVKDSLKKPLTGQQVLIPLGSKAFLPGTLRPSVSSGGEEQVVVRDQDGNDIEMTRTQALDCLQVELDSLKPPSRTKAVNVKSALRKSKPSSTASKQPVATHTPMNPSMPYFEIREEYNDSGEQINAQATNVSKQLEYLQKQAAGE